MNSIFKFLLTLLLVTPVFSQQKMVKSVDTIADLKRQNPADVHKEIMVHGIAAKGDGGGGVYMWDATSAATQDGFEYVNANITSAGRWVRGAGNRGWRIADLNRDGAVSITEFQSAIDSAKRFGAKQVVVPNATYSFTDKLNIWSGIELVAEGKVSLVRNHFLVGNFGTGSYDGDRAMIQIYTGATMRGIHIDGNNDATSVSVAGGADAFNSVMNTNGIVNQTPYGDIIVDAGAFDYGPDGNTPDSNIETMVRIENCTFTDACGSSIKVGFGGRNILITGCRFGEYYDHAVYFGGWPSLSGTNLPGEHISIIANQFIAPLATRGNVAVKMRNYTGRVLVSDNILNLPNDTFFTADVGDIFGGSAANGPITISGNSGFVARFFASGCENVSEANRLLVEGNNVTVSGYVFQSSFESGAILPSGSVTILDNIFKSSDETVAILFPFGGNTGSSNINATTWTIKDNEFHGIFNFYPVGFFSLEFSNNLLFNRRAPGSGDPIAFSHVSNNGLIPSTTNQWVFKDNRLYNYATFMFESSDTLTGGTNFLSAASIIFDGNLMWGHPTRNWLIDMRGAVGGAYAGPNIIRIKNNTVVSAVTSGASTTVPAASLVIEENYTTGGVNIGAESLVTSGLTNTSRFISFNSSIALGAVGTRRFSLGISSATESGANVGSDFFISRSDDNGAFLGQPFSLNRSSGAAIFDGSRATFSNAGGSPNVVLAGTGATTSLDIRADSGFSTGVSFQNVSTNLWNIIASTNLQSGSNVGKDFRIVRSSDAGVALGIPVEIIRASGVVVMGEGVQASDITVNDLAYDATTWNGSTNVPTRNAVRDVIEGLIGSDTIAVNGLDATDVNLVSTPFDITVTMDTGTDPDQVDFTFARTADIATDPTLLTGFATFGVTGVVFEGTTADANEGLLTATTITGDRTWTLPDASGTIALTSQLGDSIAVNGVDVSDALGVNLSSSLDITVTTDTGTSPDTVATEFARTAVIGSDPALLTGYATFGTVGVVFEGTTANTFEGLLDSTDVSADRTWTLPDITGTLALLEGAQTFSGNKTFSGALIQPIDTIAALDVDWSLGNNHFKSISGNSTFTFSNPTAGQWITVKVTATGAFTATWPTVTWRDGVTPTQTSTKTDFWTFFYDGTTYYGEASQNY